MKLIKLITAVVAVGVLVVAAPVQAQQVKQTVNGANELLIKGVSGGLPASLAAGTSALVTNVVFPIPPGAQYLSFSPFGNSTAASNVSHFIAFSYTERGTNAQDFTTEHVVARRTCAAADFRFVTNFPRSVFGEAKWAKYYSISNDGAGTFYPTNAVFDAQTYPIR